MVDPALLVAVEFEPARPPAWFPLFCILSFFFFAPLCLPSFLLFLPPFLLSFRKVPPAPSVAECAVVAYQLSDPREARGGTGPSRRSLGQDGDGVFRLRNVVVGFGGRISASWQSMLPATTAATTTTSSGRYGGSGGCRPCGYSWAIVRTRGVCRDSDSGASRVIRQGVVHYSCGSGGSTAAARTAGTGGGGGDKAENMRKEFVGTGPQPSLTAPTPTSGASRSLSTPSSPWRWQSLEADTAGWLPGDVLGLWIRVDSSQWCRGPAACPPPSGAEATLRTPGDKDSGDGSHVAEGKSGGDRALGYSPRVRDFVLRTVDDARARDIAGRARVYSHRHRPAAAEVLADGRKDGQVLHGVERDKGWGTGAGGSCGNVAVEAGDAVRLDFATMCPMNMAAAGGSWAL